MRASDSVALALAVAQGGGLGSLGCGMLSNDAIKQRYADFTQKTKAPLNLNFFVHTPVDPSTPANQESLSKWHESLQKLRRFRNCESWNDCA